MNLKRTALALVLLLLAMSSVYAASPRSLDFNGITIRLGQSSNQALTQLHGKFDLQPVAGKSGEYNVFSKDKPILLGTVAFNDSRVVRLERDRGTVFDIGQGTIMTTLVKELVKESNTVAEISIARKLQNGVTQEIITLKLPGKRLLITIADSTASNGQITFREILE